MLCQGFSIYGLLFALVSLNQAAINQAIQIKPILNQTHFE